MIVIGVALYILVLPVVPVITLWIEKKIDKTDGYVYQNNLTPKKPGAKSPKLKPIPKDNRLVLPMISLDEPIHEGRNFWVLSKGLWRKPIGSTPDKNGNTVIVGHRFTYNGPAVLYHLDKIKKDDKFMLYWQGKEYDYQVTEVMITNPLDLSVEQSTETPTLTIYTCTPLWSAKQRLVVRAELIKEAP